MHQHVHQRVAEPLTWSEPAGSDDVAQVIAEVEAEWTAQIGPRRMAQLRDALHRLREITDPYR